MCWHWRQSNTMSHHFQERSGHILRGKHEVCDPRSKARNPRKESHLSCHHYITHFQVLCPTGIFPAKQKECGISRRARLNYKSPSPQDLGATPASRNDQRRIIRDSPAPNQPAQSRHLDIRALREPRFLCAGIGRTSHILSRTYPCKIN